MRHIALALVLAAVARAADDDGSLAPDTRWNHARGPASGNAMSAAEPPETFGRVAWTYKAKGAILFTPVVWDGAVFVVDGDAKRVELLALDAETGEVWARTAVHAPSQPAVFARNVFLVEEGRTLAQIALSGRTFSRVWSYEAGAGASSPCVIDGEVYLVTPGALLSLRPGLSQPAWRVEGAFTGEPSVRDGHVYALRRDGQRLLLSAYARADGAEATSIVLAEKAPAGPGGRIALGGHIAAALIPPESGHTWAILSRTPGDKGPQLGLVRTEKLLTDPLTTNFIIIAMAEEAKAWCGIYLDEKQPRRPFVGVSERPDLFESTTSCIWLGEAGQCFGDWCGNVVNNVLFWHARERPEGAVLRKGLRFHAVPARDALLLFVPADGKLVLAVAPEEVR